MPDNSQEPSEVTLSLEPETQWTLHHVLLDRLEQEETAEDPNSIDPPPVAVFEAFETLDAGEVSFTISELEALRTVLAEQHHSTTWEHERPRLEELLHEVTQLLDRHETAQP